MKRIYVKHHISPEAFLLRNLFSIREANSLTNICYLVDEENQSIGNSKPCKYLEEYRRLRHFGPAMKSHLIPHHRQSPIWSTSVRRGHRLFQRERLAMNCTAFNRAAGTKLFRKD